MDKQINEDMFEISWNFSKAENPRECPTYSNVVYAMNRETSEVQRYEVYPPANSHKIRLMPGIQFDVTVTAECVSTLKSYAKATIRPRPIRNSIGYQINCANRAENY